MLDQLSRDRTPVPPSDPVARNAWYSSLSSAEQAAIISVYVQEANSPQKRKEYSSLLNRNHFYRCERTRLGRRTTPVAHAHVTVTTAARPRERRDGSRRHSTRGGTDDDSDPEPAPSERLCECGCGRSIAHKRADAYAFDAACKKRVQRRRQAETLQPLAADGCSCSDHPFAFKDQDGDQFCLWCGRPIGSQHRQRSSLFDDLDVLIRSNGVRARCRTRLAPEWRLAVTA